MKNRFFCLIAVATVVSTPVVSTRVGADEPATQFKTVLPGVEMTLLAEDPDLVTPTGVDVDQQGRIWVVATHTHFRPEDYDGPVHDEILVFEDADGDSNYDRRVFYNDTDATMDLELGRDGWVYLAERDRVLRVRDRDGDGVGDEEENIAVLTTEADYPHNGISGLAWHPSGDLIFGLGENYAKPWSIKGTDGAETTGTGEGGIFRCAADGKGLRRIAQGFWNPFGICVREDGEIFAAENDPGSRPPCRLLHVMDGGDYGYQREYGNAAHHPFVCWNGQLRGTLPMVHPTGEAPCGVIPLGGGLIVPTWSDHRLDFFPLKRKGASFTSERVVLAEGGSEFRPVCISRQRHVTPAANGKITYYVTDWVFVSYQLHKQGRLWRLDIDPEKATSWLQSSSLDPPSEAAALAARLRDPDSDYPRDKLLEWVNDEDRFLARSALISLSRKAPGWNAVEISAWPEADRVWAVQAVKLAAARQASAVDVGDWIESFLADESSEVLFETLRWICDDGLTEYLPHTERLLHKENLHHRLFDAIMATQNTLAGNPADGVGNVSALMRILNDPQASLQIRAHALRLLPTKLPKKKEGKLPTTKQLRAMLDWKDANLSIEVVRRLASDSKSSTEDVLGEIASNEEYPVDVRVEAVATLASARHVARLLKLAASDEPSIREEALRSLRGSVLSDGGRQRLQEIASSFPGSKDLVEAALDPQSLSKSRPALDDIDAWEKRLASIDSPADPKCGERIFNHSRVALCTQCHRHSGRGNAVGPDLSQVGKGQGRRWLLEALLQPSMKVAPEYRTRILLLDDGSIFTGIHLRTGGGGGFETLRDNQGKERRILRSEIESSRESNTSLMPDGLTDTLTDRELRDLVAFLEADAQDDVDE